MLGGLVMQCRPEQGNLYAHRSPLVASPLNHHDYGEEVSKYFRLTIHPTTSSEPFRYISIRSTQNQRALEMPEILVKFKARFAAWQKEMEAADPRGPFRDY